MRITTIQEMEKAALEIRVNLLELCNKEVIHIGGDLSIADIMTVLWQYQMNYNPRNPQDESQGSFCIIERTCIGCYKF